MGREIYQKFIPDKKPIDQQSKPTPEKIIWEFLAHKPALQGLIEGNPTVHSKAKKVMQTMKGKHSENTARKLLELAVDEQTNPTIAEGAIALLKNIPPEKVSPTIQSDIEIFSADLNKKKFQKRVNNIRGKIKRSKANLGRSPSEEQRAKLSKANLGKKLTLEHKEKIGDAHRGKAKSPAHKEKISIGRGANPLTGLTPYAERLKTYHEQGLSYKEMAEKEGVSESSVKSTISRARKKVAIERRINGFSESEVEEIRKTILHQRNQGLSYQQIADGLKQQGRNISTESVKQYVYRNKKKQKTK